MKTHNHHHAEIQQTSQAVVASLLHPRAASTALRFPSASGDNGRIAKRPASQQPAARQPNPNPKRAPRVVAGGTLGAGMDLHFPQFPSIASRRDLPLIAANSAETANTLSGVERFSGENRKADPQSEPPDGPPSPGGEGRGEGERVFQLHSSSGGEGEHPRQPHKTRFAFEHQPLLRDTGIND